MNFVKCILVLTFVAGTVPAQSPEAGQVAFPFLNLQYDGRSIGMAGADAAMPNEIYGILSNPAAMGYISSFEFMAGFRPVLMDVWGSPVAIARPWGKAGVFAANMVSLNSGNIDIRDGQGNPVEGSAFCNYLAGGIVWSKIVWNTLSVGAGVKGVYNYLSTGIPGEKYTADGAAFDAGVQYRQYRDRLIYGLVFRNIGFMRSGYTDDDVKYPLPMAVEAGVSFIPRYMPALRAALDINARRGDYINFEPGLEINIYKKILQIRGGYSFSEKDMQEGINLLSGDPDESYIKSNWSGLSFGAGVNSELDKVALHIDVAVQFLTGIPAPSFVVSAFAAF